MQCVTVTYTVKYPFAAYMYVELECGIFYFAWQNCFFVKESFKIHE